MSFYPSVIETTGRSSRAFDLPTKLLQDRIVYLSGVVTPELSDVIIMQMLWLEADNPDEPINLYIHSPGGEVNAGYAIKDVMDHINCKVNTIGVGSCSSMGAFLLAAGTGKRKAMKNCRVMIHSVSSGFEGTVHDIEIQVAENNVLQEKIIQDLTVFTGGKLSFETVNTLCRRDCYMSAKETLAYGFIDEII